MFYTEKSEDAEVEEHSVTHCQYCNMFFLICLSLGSGINTEIFISSLPYFKNAIYGENIVKRLNMCLCM
jgi:hypothetical protein